MALDRNSRKIIRILTSSKREIWSWKWTKKTQTEIYKFPHASSVSL